jgi:hypothetical protein
MKNSNTVKLTIRQNQMTAAQKKDQQYQADFIEFGYKNPSATELNYLEIKIKLLTKVVNECEETADFDFLGEELDGMELINGNLITTKTGTASDWFFWKSELDFLKEKQDQLLNPTPLVIEKKDTLPENPFPLVFVNFEVYNCFIDYTKKHIIDFYSDYSYLKKRLEKEKLIHKHTDINFLKFLKEDVKLIKDKEEQKFIKDNKFKSLGSSESEQRLNNFNNVFESVLKDK